MLRSLHIENVAVIRRADLELGEGFSALTGETGAGKSMIIDSINLLLGNRVPREIIRSGETRATVSAVFDGLSPATEARLSELGFEPADGQIMMQRTVSSDGKSQTRLDGQIITQTVQREIMHALISIHGQNDSQKLLQKSAHGELLDAYARPDAELAAYRAAYDAWKKVRDRIEACSRNEAERLRRSEMLRYQLDDIGALKLKDPDEEEKLTRERDRLSNLGEINRNAELTYQLLRGSEKSALSMLGRARNSLRALAKVTDGCDGMEERLEAVISEIEDVAERVAEYEDDDREDPTARIDRIEGRLDGISKLKRKYGGSIAEILAFYERAERELEEINLTDGDRARLEAEEKRLGREAAALAASLTEKRTAAAREIDRLVTESLTFLDMPKVRFSVGITPSELCATGADDVEFLISTNPGEPMLPMTKIASGGELSRILLALRTVLNDRDGASTVIFDEIDTGISGKTSRKVGIKLHEAAKHSQVLCVTHSAQIASLADTHYLITKGEKDGRAETEVRLLDDRARVEEIARILGGIRVTDAQRTAAKEMLEEYR